jgi:protoheme IX farnesyltransferase
MVLVTTFVGFYLGSLRVLNWSRLLQTLIGTALAAGGTLALNQYFERDVDARMERTRLRPLPEGRLQPVEVLIFGVTLAIAGPLYLTLAVNTLSGLVTAFIVLSYLFLYTPLKQRSPLCSIVGAIPGALPPVIGWVAAHGDLGLGAWMLFAILFLWQLPHSLAIAILYREDYARAGIRVLPVIEPDGGSTGRLIVCSSLGLLLVSLLPTLAGLAGSVYFITAFVLGVAFLGSGFVVASRRSAETARYLLLASLVYLATLLVAMAFDKAPLQT